MSHPFAEMVAKRVPLALVVEPVTKELYGYAVPVLDAKAQLAAFSAAYQLASRKRSVPAPGFRGYLPSESEREAAMAIFENRERAVAGRA